MIIKNIHSREQKEERLQEIHDFAIKHHATQPELVLQCLEEAIELAREINDIPMLLKSMYRRAYGLRVEMLKLEEALCLLHSALDIAVKHNLKFEEGIIYNNIANYYYALGDFSKAKDFFLKHSKIYAELHDYQGQAESLATVALMSTHEGKFTDGFQCCQEGFTICERHQIDVPYHLYYNTATIYANIGDFGKALEYYFLALEIGVKNKYISVQAAAYSAISKVYQDNGEAENALEYAVKALAFHEKFVNPSEKAVLLAMIAENMAALDRTDEAEYYIKQAWEIVKDKGLRPLELRLLMGSATLALKMNNIPKALYCLEAALELSEEIHANKDKATILLQMGKLLPDDKKGEYLLKAFTTAQEIGFKATLPEIYMALYEYYEKKGDIHKALESFKLFHSVKQEIQGEEAIRRIEILRIQIDAEKARTEASILKLENEKLEQESQFNRKKLDEIASDLIQKNQVLSQIKQNTQEASRQHGLKQKKTLQTIIKTAEEGATSFWQQLEERSKLIEGNFIEKMVKICPELTAIELRILLLLKQGISNKEISQILFIGERTIEYHRTSIRKKLQLGRSGNLVNYINSLPA